MAIPFISKEKKLLQHRGSDIRSFELDLIFFDKIILELKCLQFKFLQSNFVQIISHLKLWKKHLGLLVNFGLQRVNVERVPFTELAFKKINYEIEVKIKPKFNGN